MEGGMILKTVLYVYSVEYDCGITIIGSLPGIKVRKLNLLSKNILFEKIY